MSFFGSQFASKPVVIYSAQDNHNAACKTWNTTFSKCQECHSGFTGPNCMIKCRYPGFGRECQNVCNCDKTLCNPSTGCKDGSPTISPISTTTNIKKTSVIWFTTEKINTSTIRYFEEDHKLQAMMYSTVVLCVSAILQISIYLLFEFLVGDSINISDT